MDKDLRKIITDHRDRIAHEVDLDTVRPYVEESSIFTSNMLPEIRDMNEMCEELCSRGPSAFALFTLVLEKSGYHKLADFLESKAREIPSYLFYKMNSNPLGYCLIINNIKFEGKNKDRIGSDIDERKLKEAFSLMGFDVFISRDLFAIEMFNTLKEFANKKEFKYVHACVVIILTHGNKDDELQGIDLKFIKKSDIYPLFDNNNKNLRFKPKIFFFGACRGAKDDDGIYGESISIDSSDEGDCYEEEKSLLLPSLTDIFIVHSCLPGFACYRHHEQGAYFCAALERVLMSTYRSYDFNAMMVFLSKKIASMESVKNKKLGIHYEQMFPLKIIHFNQGQWFPTGGPQTTGGP